MTANTRQTTTTAAPPVEPPAASVGTSTTNKSSIRMAAHGPLTALHALANSYRQMMDLLKEARKDSIKILQKFTDDGYQKALDAAKDSKHALYMQAGASFLGGGLAIGGLIANRVVGAADDANKTLAAQKKDFLEGIKKGLSTGDANLTTSNGQQAGAVGNLPSLETSEAMSLIKNNQMDDLYRRNKVVLPGEMGYISDIEISDAAKFLHADRVPLIQHDPIQLPVNQVEILKNITDHIMVQSNTMNTSSQNIARSDAGVKSLVDLAQGVQQGGFSIGQAKDNEKARQEEADVAKIGQLQKMTDQAQSDFSESNKQLSRDLSSISEQVGRIIPQRA